MFIMQHQAQEALSMRVFSRQALATESTGILLMTGAVPLLQDDVLKLLFSTYKVELCKDASALFIQRSVPIVIALLPGAASAATLDIHAHIIRDQWPLARIILIGKPPRELEDFLYDHTVAEGCTFRRLTAALHARSGDLWNQTHGNCCIDKLTQGPAESDPTKAEPSDLEETPVQTPRDVPADEQQNPPRARARLSQVSV